MKKIFLYLLLIILSLPLRSQSLVRYLTGSAEDVSTPALGGLFLVGGSADQDSAFKWFLQRAAGGDIVVIRASGADGYNDFMFNLAKVNSVETFLIDSREKAFLPELAEKIRQAEALFIAGGDQSRYVKFWKNSPVDSAINYLINTKKVTVGGTSAGLAILGSAYYSAFNESATSVEVLANPYHENVTLGSNDFLVTEWMKNTITDSHYSQRDRMGRHIGFMARLMQDSGYKTIKGIGIDEKTSLCIDQFGMGKVYGPNKIYFLKNNGKGPERCETGKALDWNRKGKALVGYVIEGSTTGNGSFNAGSWEFSGGKQLYYSVIEGKLVVN